MHSFNFASDELAQHVVIAGGGRIGMQIAKILHGLRIPFVIIELDQRLVEMAKEAGFKVVFGDASQTVVLEAANTARAVLLVVSIPGVVVAQAIIHNARLHNPTIQVVARLADTEFMPVFDKLKVRDLVYPEFEAGLEMTRQALLHLGLPVQEVHQHTEPLRQEFLQLKDKGEHLLLQYKTLAQLRTAEQSFDLEWFSVQANSVLLGQSLAEAQIRTRTGVSVVGVLRCGAVQANPGPDFRLQGKDMVAVIGSSEARSSFHAMLVTQSADQDIEADAPKYAATA